LNRKEEILVIVVVLTIFVGRAFADTISTTPVKTTLQTTSVDIVLYNNIPSAMEIWNIPTQLSIPEVNFTTAFSFAPSIGFVRVTSVALSMTFLFSTYTGLPTTNNGLIVVINGQSAGTLTLPVFAEIATASGFLGVQGLHAGSNMINIGLPVNDVVTLYGAHLTVEYTFLG